MEEGNSFFLLRRGGGFGPRSALKVNYGSNRRSINGRGAGALRQAD